MGGALHMKESDKDQLLEGAFHGSGRPLGIIQCLRDRLPGVPGDSDNYARYKETDHRIQNWQAESDGEAGFGCAGLVWSGTNSCEKHDSCRYE